MRTDTIWDPAKYGPGLHTVIENTPEAFTEGRRNNDIVNWFLAVRLRDIESPIVSDLSAFKMDERYWNEFTEILSRLTDEQRTSLMFWDESPRNKINTLVYSYYKIEDPMALARLWLPMEYGLVDDEQLTMDLAG